MRCLAIIPAFNEGASVADVVREIHQAQPDCDVVVVDDGSSDATAVAAREAGATVLQLPFNLGIGGAVQTGYRYAWQNDYEIAIQVDADGQHPPIEIANVIGPIVRGEADMVTGTRFLGTGGFQSSATRRVGIKLFAGLVSLIIREKVTDTTSGFRAVNRKGIALFSVAYPQDYPEVETQALAHQHGLRLLEVPVVMRERQAGESSIRLGASVYYVIKVTLALFIGMFRGPILIPESAERP